jgi:hypothetical protein
MEEECRNGSKVKQGCHIDRASFAPGLMTLCTSIRCFRISFHILMNDLMHRQLRQTSHYMVLSFPKGSRRFPDDLPAVLRVASPGRKPFETKSKNPVSEPKMEKAKPILELESRVLIRSSCIASTFLSPPQLRFTASAATARLPSRVAAALFLDGSAIHVTFLEP